MAQLGRALRSGRRGRVFESRHSDFFIEMPQNLKIDGTEKLPFFKWEFFLYNRIRVSKGNF